MTSNQTSGITGVLTVAVPTSDQEKALAFYTDKLGCEVTRDQPYGPGMRWIEVALPKSSTTIALPPSQPGTQIGVDTGVRLACENAEKTHDYLADNGVDVDDVMNFGPSVPPMFSFRDADGNTLYLVQS